MESVIQVQDNLYNENEDKIEKEKQALYALQASLSLGQRENKKKGNKQNENVEPDHESLTEELAVEI